MNTFQLSIAIMETSYPSGATNKKRLHSLNERTYLASSLPYDTHT